MRLNDDQDQIGGINLMPLVDVVFLLLIFFLAATTFVSEEIELDLRLPEARSGDSGTTKQQLIINVSRDGTLTMSGRPVQLDSLRQRLAAAAARNKDQSVLIRGDKSAEFGVGLQVLDMCRLAKIKKVEFAALPSKKG